MERVKQLIQQILTTPPKKEKCNCGCNSCKNVGNPGPVLNENLNSRIVMSKNMRYHVKNKLSILENSSYYGSKEYLDLWAEARYLYSRNVIHVNDRDKKILTETHLGEYGMYNGKQVPLDLPILEVEDSELGTRLDKDITPGNFMLPYQELLHTIDQDWGQKDLYHEVEQAIFDKDSKQVINVLKNWDVYNEYKHLLNVNEAYKYVIVKGKVTKQKLNEDSAAKLYKVEGLLVTNNDLLFQKEVLSDIRSIEGITTVDAREYTPRLPKKNYSYDRLTIKIDPYPYLLQNKKFDIETVKGVIADINKIRGIVKFRVDNPQLINVGI